MTACCQAKSHVLRDILHQAEAARDTAAETIARIQLRLDRHILVMGGPLWARDDEAKRSISQV